MGVGQLSESDAVDALRLPFYSSSHPTGSHGWRNQFDLGNPDLSQGAPTQGGKVYLSGATRQVLECLQQRGACFSREMVQWTRQLPTKVETALGELVASGLVTCDGFAALRSMISPLRHRSLHRRHQRPRETAAMGRPERMAAGRWSLLPRGAEEDEDMEVGERTEFLARQLLRRYGIVFPRLLHRETNAPPWRELLRVYRRLEARGEVRGGRFVSGFSGEQYALPEAVQQLRAIRRTKPNGSLVTVNGADPLNLVGILTPGPRVPSLPSNRIQYRDGVPIALTVGGHVSSLDPRSGELQAIELALRG